MLPTVQIFEITLGVGERPCPGRDCPQCGGRVRLQKHGSYHRYCEVDGSRSVVVQRYLCPRCERTWSVIPAGMMPYRSMPVQRFEQLADERFGLADGGARPPPATEKEDGCIRRAMQKLSKRIPLLHGLFGQQLPVFGNTDICRFWRAMRELGPTLDTLVRLACEFKTSLLLCYRSLLPHWEREPTPT